MKFPSSLKQFLAQRRKASASRRETEGLVARERVVDKTIRDMDAIGLGVPALRRIVSNALGWLEAERLTEAERHFAQSQGGERAAVKQLARRGLFGLELLEPYAATGYQRFMVDEDPLIASVSTSYRGGPITRAELEVLDLRVYIRDADAGALGRIMPHAWHYADPNSEFAKDHPEAHQTWCAVLQDELNEEALGQMLDPHHRNAATPTRRTALSEVWESVRA